MNLLEEIIQESAELQRIVLLEPVPPGPICPMWSNTGVMSLSASSAEISGSDWARERRTSYVCPFSIPHSYTGGLPWSVGFVRRLLTFSPGSGDPSGSRFSRVTLCSNNHTQCPPWGGARGGGFCTSLLGGNASSLSQGDISLRLWELLESTPEREPSPVGLLGQRPAACRYAIGSVILSRNLIWHVGLWRPWLSWHYWCSRQQERPWLEALVVGVAITLHWAV